MQQHHHHKAFVQDVVSYFHNHRPWKNIHGEEMLENQEDRMLYEKARTIIDSGINESDIMLTIPAPLQTEDDIDEYLDAEEEQERKKTEFLE